MYGAQTDILFRNRSGEYFSTFGKKKKSYIEVWPTIKFIMDKKTKGSIFSWHFDKIKKKLKFKLQGPKKHKFWKNSE